MRAQTEINSSIRAAERAHAQGRTPTHREMYPKQYAHPSVGKRCKVVIDGNKKAEGTIVRVIGSMYGKLVKLKGQETLWLLRNCQIV